MDVITRLNIRIRCRLVGEDEFGNRYYEAKKPTAGGRRKRYVLYSGRAEASKVPADWHGWLHYVEASPPPATGLPRYAWQKPHMPNVTGTIYAYRPAGHLLGDGKRAKATGDYQAWKPKPEENS